jgi:hypothetical protein
MDETTHPITLGGGNYEDMLPDTPFAFYRNTKPTDFSYRQGHGCHGQGFTGRNRNAMQNKTQRSL